MKSRLLCRNQPADGFQPWRVRPHRRRRGGQRRKLAAPGRSRRLSNDAARENMAAGTGRGNPGRQQGETAHRARNLRAQEVPLTRKPGPSPYRRAAVTSAPKHLCLSRSLVLCQKRSLRPATKQFLSWFQRDHRRKRAAFRPPAGGGYLKELKTSLGPQALPPLPIPDASAPHLRIVGPTAAPCPQLAPGGVSRCLA